MSLDFDSLPDGRVSLERRRFGGDGQRLRDRAGLERDVHGDPRGGVEPHADLQPLLEAFELHLDVVGARGERRKDAVPGRVADN